LLISEGCDLPLKSDPHITAELLDRVMQPIISVRYVLILHFLSYVFQPVKIVLTYTGDQAAAAQVNHWQFALSKRWA